MRRIVAGPVVFGVAILAALSLLLVGLRVTTSLAIVDQPANVASLSPKPELLRGAVEPPTARSDGAMMRAPANLLQPAIQKGVDGLRELREDYPRDPALLEALAVAHAAKPTGALQALDTLDALFAVVPAKARDERLAAIVTKASLGPANVAARALALMAQRMGQAGADQLYDLYVTSPAVRTAARAQLDDPRTREHFTPALAVAYDLRRTEGCADKRKLLQRAAEVGDDRSVTILQILSNPTRKGCGYRNRKPCPPPCAEQASELKRAASSIQNRLSAEAQSAKPGTKASHE